MADDEWMYDVGPADRETAPLPYSKEFIPASQSSDGKGNWRIFDHETDSRVATCYDSRNADLIVDALNGEMQIEALEAELREARRAVSTAPSTEKRVTSEQWESAARKVMAMYDWSKAERRAINDFILTAREGAAEVLSEITLSEFVAEAVAQAPMECDEDTHYWEMGSPTTGERCNCGHKGWTGSLAPLIAEIEALPVRDVQFTGDLGSTIEALFINRKSVLAIARKYGSPSAS